MKIYLSQNVFDAALDRMRWLFDEFPDVTICFSGGKDSTVILNLALIIAEEKGQLPVKVLFIDQEAEWQAVIDYIRIIMQDPRVDPQWLQIPIKLFNSTSTTDPWLYCWDPDKEDQWMRERETISIKENTFTTDRFTELFGKILLESCPNGQGCQISGVRTEESPSRLLGLTNKPTYKWVTWGRKHDAKKNLYAFYPIYDWSYTDVWKAIHDNKWTYCKIYDYMWQYGYPPQRMRVSNVHHETAVQHLFYLQEIEPDTWNKLTKRISGINTAGKLIKDFFCPSDLPYMFNSWRDYRDHLLDNLIDNSEQKDNIRKSFVSDERRYSEDIYQRVMKMHISMILTNDYHGTKRGSFSAGAGKYLVRGRLNKGKDKRSIRQMLDDRH